MADTKISAQTAVTTPTSTSELAVNEDGTAKKLTIDQLQDAYPAFHVNRNGVTQDSIVSGVATKIKWTTEVLDSTGAFSADADDSGGATESRFIPLVAGKYLILIKIAIVTLTADKWVSAHIYKNGSSVAFREDHLYFTSTTAGMVWTVVDMNGSTDYIEGFAQHGNGSNRNLNGDVDKTYMTGFRIAT